MILHPTVVIGLGSTGKFVVANAQKYLYEVLNGEELKLFKFLVLETAVNQQDQGWTSVGVTTKPIDIKVQDIGSAYFTLKENLGSEFTNWCPENMHIVGPGAGNKRAGGRLMLLHHMNMVQGIVQKALDEVKAAAMDDHTTRHINKLLKDRGGNELQHPLPNQPVPVVLVVGTLTGGTCSGACVDLGYLLRKIAPSSPREAIFFIPDSGAIGTYKANAWAALSDLVYFTEHPGDYEAVWLNRGQGRESHSEGGEVAPIPPYKHIYLVTQRDRPGNAHLPYRDDPGSPLLMMGGLYVAADLLGLHQLRQTRLVDLNTRVGQDRVFNTFLTHSIRGISYPKYEISEAAACKIIADRICHYWLSKDEYWEQGRRGVLQREDTSRLGREFWNKTCSEVWVGLRGKQLDLASKAIEIKSGQITDVANHLKAQIGENREGTIFRKIDQNVEHRRRELQHAVRSALVEHLQSKQNLQFGEWFLDGVREEIERARKYWQAIEIPPGEHDMLGWQARVDKLVDRLVARYTGLSVNMLSQRLNVIEDELEQIVVRLEMFLMHRALGDISRWIDTDLKEKSISSIRTLLTEVQTYTKSRADAIAYSLQDRSGPLLKLSRSDDNQFANEISTLAAVPLPIEGKDFVDYENGHFCGLLYPGQTGSSPRDRVFQHLIERIQPALIREMQQEGSIDIVKEIERHQVGPQAIQRAHATQLLSLSTRHDLMTGEENVPSLLLARDTESSTRLEGFLSKSDQAFPVLRKDELPMFDHMALFYQEGGKFKLDSLLYGDDLKRAYEEARKTDDEGVLDPLRHLKKHAPQTQAEPRRDS